MLCFALNKQVIQKNYIQWIATFTMFLIKMQEGFVVGWGSPNIARYLDNASEIYLTPDEITWVSSSKELAGVFGALFGPLSMQILGPNATCLIFFIVYLGSWTCILVANGFIVLVIGRVLSGIADNATAIAFAIYLGEVSHPELRGTMISIAATGAIPGIIFSAFLEAHFSPQISCPVYMVGCLIGLAFLIFVLPESPYFLGKSKNIDKTKKSIAVYFPDEKVEEKLLSIQNFVKSQSKYSLKERLGDIFGSAPTRKLMLLTAILAALCSGSGIVNLQRYLQPILEEGNSHVIEPKNALIYINITTLVLRMGTCNLVDKFGRKFLFVSAGILASLSLFISGVYFSLLHSNVQMNDFGWVLVTCIFVFKTSYSLGFYTAMFTILGELCPPNAKNVSNCLSYLCVSFVSFLFTKIHLPVSHKFGLEYIFWTHAACSFLVIPIVLFLLPESKGKKLEDV